MIKKTLEKRKAVRLRREGKTYSEILSQIPVAKSTLSIWLGEVGLSKPQKQRITELRMISQKKGALRRRMQRVELSTSIFEQAEKEIGSINERELWLIGTMLYWAEGSKQKDWNVSQPLQFTNSDPIMIRLFLKWLKNSLKIEDSELIISLAIHENSKSRLPKVVSHWKSITGIKDPFSDRVYFKRHKDKGYRRNLGEKYYGTVRITVKRSTNLNRKITGWVNGVCKNCGIV